MGQSSSRGAYCSPIDGAFSVLFLLLLNYFSTEKYCIQIPDIVARLASLHATVTSRLSLQERLLSLNGRLDLVLAQVELRSSNAPADVSGPQRQKAKTNAPRRQKLTRYVEGESEVEEGGKMDVDVEGSDEGSVEDVELGGSEDEEEGDDDEEESGSLLGSDDEEDSAADSDEDDDDEGGGRRKGPRVNGFIDGEAEETWAEDESEDSDED